MHIVVIMQFITSSQKLSYPITNGKETNNTMILQATAH